MFGCAYATEWAAGPCMGLSAVTSMTDESKLLTSPHGSHRYHSPVAAVIRVIRRISERSENRNRLAGPSGMYLPYASAARYKGVEMMICIRSDYS